MLKISDIKHTLITLEMLPMKNWHFWFAESSAAVFTDFLVIHLLDLVHHSHRAAGFLFCTT